MGKTVKEMKELQNKLSAALASADKEHEDALQRREEANNATEVAAQEAENADAKAAASQQHADELEVALKRAQLQAAGADKRAEEYSGDAATSKTALEDAQKSGILPIIQQRSSVLDVQHVLSMLAKCY